MRHTLVTISVAGPCPDWVAPWLWTVDGPLTGMVQGFEADEGAAWAAARDAAAVVLARLETPGGGAELRTAIEGDDR